VLQEHSRGFLVGSVVAHVFPAVRACATIVTRTAVEEICSIDVLQSCLAKLCAIGRNSDPNSSQILSRFTVRPRLQYENHQMGIKSPAEY
jgi:hypothetical protein